MPAAMAGHHLDRHPQNNQNFIMCGQWKKCVCGCGRPVFGVSSVLCVLVNGVWTEDEAAGMFRGLLVACLFRGLLCYWCMGTPLPICGWMIVLEVGVPKRSKCFPPARGLRATCGQSLSYVQLV
jgi:hypothetical protein